MIAEAFARVRFPIIPVIHQDEDGKLTLIRANSKLITPRDFDNSPYFDVIKYPIIDFDELGIYRKMPWDQTSVHCNKPGDCFYSDSDEIQNLIPIASSDSTKPVANDTMPDNIIAGNNQSAGEKTDKKASN